MFMLNDYKKYAVYIQLMSTVDHERDLVNLFEAGEKYTKPHEFFVKLEKKFYEN